METIAVPADPEKPEMNSIGRKQSVSYSGEGDKAQMRIISELGNCGRRDSNLGGRHMEQCIRTDDCLPKERLWLQ